MKVAPMGENVGKVSREQGSTQDIQQALLMWGRESWRPLMEQSGGKECGEETKQALSLHPCQAGCQTVLSQCPETSLDPSSPSV